MISALQIGARTLIARLRVRVWGWVSVRVLGYSFGVRAKKVKSRE